ncbi:MAG: type II toxin-antitoxin system PemK/MazF family toxin [Candidatus Parabeggiatoa sp. nov. 3]|nr:MAG: type II toxin-antitoxin system PemK/MazF family toxin [Gammaproteobacteria bacterium]RKZ68120.1 MAG: type II toxin-antitoxin system PemK/MazF family toxin [Gammaproteobacteria bacterium]RKZ83789.1 MAG: type II toxin-antitoxin system PemK/MazF family toxin [Gammaproteobacteria bacterium]
MMVKRGEIWLAELNPIRGSELAGTRPVLIFQNDLINPLTTTVLAIPMTKNLRRALLPSCIQISKGEGGLASDSVALCHQFRVLDKIRLQYKFGSVTPQTMAAIETCMLFTLGVITDI